MGEKSGLFYLFTCASFSGKIISIDPIDQNKMQLKTSGGAILDIQGNPKHQPDSKLKVGNTVTGFGTLYYFRGSIILDQNFEGKEQGWFTGVKQ